MEGKVISDIYNKLRVKIKKNYSTLNKNNMIYDAIIGDLLGDGHIRFQTKTPIKDNQ